MTSDDNGYIVLDKISDNESFLEKMITKAIIPNTIPLQLRHINNNEKYYYDVKNMISLHDKAKVGKFNRLEIQNLYESLSEMTSILSEYLLSDEILIINPNMIFYDGNIIKYILYPDNTSRSKDGYEELAEFLIDYVDNSDELAVEMVYGFYEKLEGGIIDPVKCIVCEESCIEPQLSASYENRSLEEETESKFYFMENNEEEEEISKTDYIKPLFMCAILIALTGAGYVYLFLNKHMLYILGIKQEYYIVFGAFLSVIMIVVMISIFRRFYMHQRKADTLTQTDEISSDEKQYENEETVFLSELSNGKNEPTQDGICAYLISSINDNIYKLNLADNKIIIGKSIRESDIVIEEDGISRKHCLIEKKDSEYYISDLNSTNGTTVNGCSLRNGEKKRLYNSDCIELSGYSFTFVDTII